MNSGSSTRRFQGALYGFYSFGQKASRGVRKRVTSLGVMVLLMVPLMIAMTAMYGRGALLQLVSVLLAVVIVSFWMVIFRAGKLEVVRDLPKLGSVGEKVRYTVHYKNLGKSGLRHFLLEDFPPNPSPSRDLFLGSIEPGEELRNGFDRLFIAYRWMWLVERRLLFSSKAVVCEKLKGGETRQCVMEIVPKRRGVVEFSSMRVLLPDPFGLFQRVRRVEQATNHLVILPKRYRVGGLQLPGSSRNQVGGEAMSMVNGQSGEFVGLREYRPGDPLRHIHWPSWARMGKPIVKEYEDVFFPRYGLFLDTAVRAEYELVFEEAVSVAASFACAVDTRECLLDLIFMQQGTKVMTVGRGVDKVESMLETLAGVEPELAPNWSNLRSLVLKHGDGLTACIVVICDWSEERNAMLAAWRSSGLTLMVFYVCEDETEGARLLEGVGGVRIVSTERVAEILGTL